MFFNYRGFSQPVERRFCPQLFMKFTELIRTRESIRNYDPNGPVPKEILVKILDAGRLSPSACNYQLIRKGNPWKKSLILCELLFSVTLSRNTLQEIFVTYRRYLFIRFISSFLSVGFEIYSLHPASIDFLRSPSIAYAVLAIIGISLLLSLIRLVVS